MKIELPMITKRECETCTKCCEGYLDANINGQKIGNGKGCIFVQIGKGCGDYENRPENPCRTYYCGWILNKEMPEEFKPNLSGVIMNFHENDGIPYIVLNQAPNNPTEQYLSWAVVFARSRNLNMLWYIDDKSWWIGTDEFCKQMSERHPVI